jgi:hypothetical protein
MDIVGIDPTTSRMRTTRSTTEPNALPDATFGEKQKYSLQQIPPGKLSVD